MSTMSVRLPDSLHQRLRALAKRERVSINQFITLAVAEKLSALDTEEYLKERAKGASRERFLEALSRVPDVPPVPGDEL
ncbi:MAG: toxin-antitoxin system HicB family antitoxin [Candidatus Brocadiae bacterium]|nr:toxin-antitoxin system HicB family antitoxin [Candidatus Brocadiia bacterium]